MAFASRITDEYELTGGAAPDWKATIAASTYFCTHLFAGIFSGRGKEHGLEKEHLSWIVDIKNERFGLQLGDADQLLFDQLRESWVAAEKLPARARNNSLDNFRLVLTRGFSAPSSDCRLPLFSLGRAPAAMCSLP